MVAKRTLSIDWFLPGAHLATQPQKTLAKDQTPPSPPLSSSCAKKKQRIGDPPKVPSDALSKTPPRASGGIVIWEPTGASRPTAQVGTNVASFSRAVAV